MKSQMFSPSCIPPLGLFSPSLFRPGGSRRRQVFRCLLTSSSSSRYLPDIAMCTWNLSESSRTARTYYLPSMNAMVLNLVAASILVLVSTVTATYRVGPWSPAHATYYGDDNGTDSNMGGACGYSDVLADFFGVHTAAPSNVLFQRGEHCGACFEIQCMIIYEGPMSWCLNDKSVVVTATNNCPVGRSGGWCDGPLEHFDLSLPAFTSIAETNGGMVPIQYRRVPCQKQGGVRFLIKGNPHFQMVLIYNVGGAGDLQSVSIKGDNTEWLPAERNWGENWVFGGYLVGRLLSVSVTTFDKVAVVSSNITNRYWQYGMTFEGSQFS